MKLDTKHFGSIEVDDGRVFDFHDGIPGFEGLKRFVLIENEEPGSPFRWLQSMEDAVLAFALVDPFAVKPDYEIEIPGDTIKRLGIENREDVLVYSIVVVPEDISKMTMNLKAPVVMCLRTKLGEQVVLDTERYGVRHYILEELRKREVMKDAGSHQEEGSIHCNK